MRGSFYYSTGTPLIPQMSRHRAAYYSRFVHGMEFISLPRLFASHIFNSATKRFSRFNRIWTKWTSRCLIIRPVISLPTTHIFIRCQCLYLWLPWWILYRLCAIAPSTIAHSPPTNPIPPSMNTLRPPALNIASGAFKKSKVDAIASSTLIFAIPVTDLWATLLLGELGIMESLTSLCTLAGTACASAPKKDAGTTFLKVEICNHICLMILSVRSRRILLSTNQLLWSTWKLQRSLNDGCVVCCF